MDNISNTTGGAYIPPSKLKLMQAQITDKSSEAYQRLAWDALKKTINGLINKINVDNFDIIVKKLLSENVMRGRGYLARTIIVAQSESPALTHVHAALVAVINSKFPQIGLLIVHRLLNDFHKSYKRNDKKRCLTCSRFFAHLVNQDVVDYVIIMELLYLLLDKTSNNSVEIAVGIMKEVGLKLEEKSKAVCMALFDKFRLLLNEGTLDKRVNYMIEVLFQIRKDKYKDYPTVREGLEFDSDDQTTHVIDLLSEGEIHDELNVFQFEPNFLENERRYEEMKEQILPESEEEDDEDEDNEEADEGPVVTVDIQDQSFLSTVELRKKIYLKIHSALTHMDAAHLLLQIPLKPEQLYEMASMILDCCAQLRIYDNKFGYLAQQMCLVNHKYVEEFERLFCENYSGIHRLDMTKIRNLAMLFAHLLCKDTVSWGIFVVVKISEKDTTSSGRIFLKHLFQEMRAELGMDTLISRFREEEMQVYFENIFPKDDLKDTKFSINFFTAIDLGKITVDMRKYFEEAKIAKLEDGSNKKKKKKNDSKDSDTDSSSDESSESDSSSDSSEEEKPNVRKSEKSSKIKERSTEARKEKKEDKRMRKDNSDVRRNADFERRNADSFRRNYDTERDRREERDDMNVDNQTKRHRDEPYSNRNKRETRNDDRDGRRSDRRPLQSYEWNNENSHNDRRKDIESRDGDRSRRQNDRKVDRDVGGDTERRNYKGHRSPFSDRSPKRSTNDKEETRKNKEVGDKIAQVRKRKSSFVNSHDSSSDDDRHRRKKATK